jgi:hypothetical protein
VFYFFVSFVVRFFLTTKHKLRGFVLLCLRLSTYKGYLSQPEYLFQKENKNGDFTSINHHLPRLRIPIGGDHANGFLPVFLPMRKLQNNLKTKAW